MTRKSQSIVRFMENYKAPEHYAEIICEHFEKANSPWLEIGKTLREAWAEYADEKEDKKKLLEQIGMSASSCSKLIKISESSRISDNWEYFKNTPQWTNLYRVISLSDEDFSKLVDELKSGHLLDNNLLQTIEGKEAKVRDNYTQLYSVSVDRNALKSGQFDASDHNKLLKLIDQIQREIPYLKVQMTNVAQDDAMAFVTEVQKECFDLHQKMFREWFKDYKATHPKWIQEKRNRVPVKDRVIDGLGNPYDVEQLFKSVLTDTASKNLNEEIERIAEELGQQTYPGYEFVLGQAEKNVSLKRSKKFAPLCGRKDAFADQFSDLVENEEQTVETIKDIKKMRLISLSKRNKSHLFNVSDIEGDKSADE